MFSYLPEKDESYERFTIGARPVPVACVLQLRQELAELDDLVGPDLGVLGQFLLVVAMVRDAVVRLGDADVRIAAVARLMADREREDAAEDDDAVVT